MAQVGNNDGFAGEYMVQDSDHLGGTKPARTQRSEARQPQQSQSHSRQQGSDDQHVSGQQGGERRRKGR